VTGSERWHGTAGGYTNHRCRCSACTAAWAEYHQKHGAQDRYRKRYRDVECLVPGCTYKVALSNPGHLVCHRHLGEGRSYKDDPKGRAMEQQRKTLADYGPDLPKYKRRCELCDEPNGGAVVLTLREAGGKARKQVASTTRTLCEAHAIEVYEAALNVVEEYGREGR
jgi:hypothetical protein